MKIDDRRESDNVEDRRGMGIPGGRATLGLGGTVIVVLVAWLFGLNPLTVLQQVTSQTGTQVSTEQGPAPPPNTANDPQAKFVSVVLAETEDVWTAQFQKMGRTYEPPHLVLFDQAVESACGIAGSAVGPFYCSRDQRVYLDLSFFKQLDQSLGAPGDFAQAYVIAHEVGHHVQTLLGITQRVDQLRAQAGSEAEANALSVRLELQADFLAGMWAHWSEKAKPMLEAGDLEEALNAASQIGDDRLQRRSRGEVVPDAFTHGTSAQRVRWFRKGWETGDLKQGDTFGAAAL
jgi:predicted metalloprotease